jgi:hypothetical protein
VLGWGGFPKELIPSALARSRDFGIDKSFEYITQFDPEKTPLRYPETQNEKLIGWTWDWWNVFQPDSTWIYWKAQYYDCFAKQSDARILIKFVDWRDNQVQELQVEPIKTTLFSGQYIA